MTATPSDCNARLFERLHSENQVELHLSSNQLPFISTFKFSMDLSRPYLRLELSDERDCREAIASTALVTASKVQPKAFDTDGGSEIKYWILRKFSEITLTCET